MSTFEQTMAALHARHPATLRRILAKLPSLKDTELDTTSATSYARYLERALGHHAFELLTSQLKTAAPPTTGVGLVADEVTDALAATVDMESIANKTADAVASAYREQGWSENFHGISDFFTSFINPNFLASFPSIDFIDSETSCAIATGTLLLYCFIMAFYCSSHHTSSVIHGDTAQGLRAYKNSLIGIAFFFISAVLGLATFGIGESGAVDYVFPAICLGALLGRWRIVLPPSRLWPSRGQPANAAKTWSEAAVHMLFFLFCTGFFAWVTIMFVAASESNDEEWRVFED